MLSNSILTMDITDVDGNLRVPEAEIPEENIDIKPSTELIADEYERPTGNNDNIEVHTFKSDRKKDEENSDLFVNTMQSHGYKINNKYHIHKLETENCSEVLQKIKSRCNDEEKDGLILFFSASTVTDKQGTFLIGKSKQEIEIKDIWEAFTADKCEKLRNKPKIFIFLLMDSSSSTETDGEKRDASLKNFEKYDTPAEADILIIFIKSLKFHNHTNFTEKLCQNINEYGAQEDITTLVTLVEAPPEELPPMVISTMTRQFYIVPGDHKGHYYSIVNLHIQLRDLLIKKKQSILPNTKKADVNDSTSRQHVSFAKATPRNLGVKKGTPMQRHLRNRVPSVSLSTSESDAVSKELSKVQEKINQKKMKTDRNQKKKPAWK